MSDASDSGRSSRPSDAHPHLDDVDSTDFRRLIHVFLGIYSAAMNYPPAQAAGRRQLWEQHAEREAFTCVAAFGEGDRPVAFAYGYRGASGQWWNTEVARGVRGTPADEWLTDYAELTELHVRPDLQGNGIGERVLRAFLTTRTEARVLLSTPEGENRAWRLYRRLGFGDVLRHYHFTGDGRPFGVLGLALR